MTEHLKKAAVYARVSTTMQAEEEVPILGQLEECQNYAREQGWEITRIYKDEGYSGGTDNRPGLQALLEAARQKPPPFDIVLTWRNNRLFRSVEYRLAYRRLFRRYKIDLVSLHEPALEGITGEFMDTVLAAADQLYRGQVSEDTLRGLKRIARAGFSTGGRPPTGYQNKRVAAGVKPNGEPIMRTVWEPDPVAAPRVLKAFQMCAQGATSLDIIKETRVVSVKSSLSTLLRNRAYLGERVYNSTKRASLSEKKTIRIKNLEDQIVRIPDSHEAIVPEELFSRVQVILDRRRPKVGQWKYTRRHYILSGLLWCKKHQEPYSGQTNGPRAYYACSARKRLGKKTAPCPYLKKEAVEKFILDNVKAYVFTREKVRQGLELLAKETACNKQEDDAESNQVLKEINQVDTELARFHKAIQEGVVASAVAKPINELEQKKGELQKRLGEIKRRQERNLKIPAITDAMVDDVIKRVHSLLDDTSPQELKAILAHLLERIEVEGEQLTVYYSVASSQQVAYNWRPRGDSNPRSPP
jgi:site-specific DNA recombinase